MGEQPSGSAEALCDLERYLATAQEKHLGLPEVEAESVARGREVVRLALQGHLDARGNGDVGAAVYLVGPGGPVRLGYKRLHTRRIVSLVGELRVTRMGYAAPGHVSICPLDAELCLPGRSFSYNFQRHLVRAAVCGPFDEAVHFLAEMTGVKVPKRSAEQIVVGAAVDFDSFYAARAGEADLPPEHIVVGAIDCKGIPMVKAEPAAKVVRRRAGEKPNKKKMATVAAVFSTAPRTRTPASVIESLFAEEPTQPDHRRQRRADKRVWASLTSGKDSFIADVAAEMARRDPERRHTWVMVTDGERALQRRVGEALPDVTLVLDFLHVIEKLWKVGHALHPEASPEAVAFVRERAERILCGRVSHVVQGLRQIVTKRGLKGQKAKTILGVTDYYYANRQRMRYDIYLANGWPIASGSVEGACKCLVRDRFERSGMRWRPDSAEAMLKMRAVYLSDDLDSYWEWHIKCDQERLYPKGSWNS